MEKMILGIDIGTTSLKAAVFNQQGEQLAAAVVEYTLLTPGPQLVEAPCGVYMESVARCMDIIRAKGAVDTKCVQVVSFSVQGETLCLLDGAGEPLCNAIVWMDNRAGAEAECLRERFGDELCYEVTGQVSFEACWPAAKLLWVKNHRPELFAKLGHVLLLEDYVIYQLTGRFVSECSLLTSTEYWDIRTREYWPEMLAYLGISEAWLPQVMEPGEPVGTILPEMAERLGVAQSALICTGCLDQAAGAIGVGNIRPGIFSENIGAALAICVPTERLTYDPQRNMPAHYFGRPGTYMMHTFTTGGMCLRWFRDNFCQNELLLQEASGLDAYELMDREAARVPPGSDGLLALPHLQGSMAPDVNLNAKAVFYGAALRHRREHFIRSIMESLGYIIRRNMEAIDSMGLEIQEIRTLGGGAKSDVWNQIKADITGKTIHITRSSQDTACLGAAILGGVAAGMFKDMESACGEMVKIQKSFVPNMENHRIYQVQYEKFKRLFAALEDLYAYDAQNSV